MTNFQCDTIFETITVNFWRKFKKIWCNFRKFWRNFRNLTQFSENLTQFSEFWRNFRKIWRNFRKSIGKVAGRPRSHQNFDICANCDHGNHVWIVVRSWERLGPTKQVVINFLFYFSENSETVASADDRNLLCLRSLSISSTKYLHTILIWY